jgi:drug/metabolite transporter (DMT)-like permease
MKVIGGFIVMISFTVAANLLLKLGAIAPRQERIFTVVDWKTLAGFAVFGLAGVIYSWVLGYLPLNVAQSYAAAQFMAVILASALVLSEPISAAQWLGILLISAGILVVSVSRGATAVN